MTHVTPEPTVRSVRRIAATFAASIAIVAVLSGCLSADQSTVQSMVNQSRAAQPAGPFGKPPALSDYTPADTKAQAWAQKLANDGKLSHSKLSDGYAGTSWCYLGENVGMGPSLSSIHSAFMNSSGHRANILSFNFNRIGSGVVYVKSTGYYFVVQEFVGLC